jgi:hypothetical protein
MNDPLKTVAVSSAIAHSTVAPAKFLILVLSQFKLDATKALVSPDVIHIHFSVSSLI